MSWGKELEQWGKETHAWVHREAAEKTRFVFKEVIYQSPSTGLTKYSTGHFIRNWLLSADAPSWIELGGTASVERKLAEIDAYIPDNYFVKKPTAFFTNSTEYLAQVEYEGWSLTPPYAPVTRAIAKSLV